jgi:hypothetical protein
MIAHLDWYKTAAETIGSPGIGELCSPHLMDKYISLIRLNHQARFGKKSN